MVTTFTSLNPRTGEPVGVFSIATEEDVRCAVAQAREAARIWATTPIDERICGLNRLRDGMAAHRDLLARLVMEEIGKPAQEAYGGDVLPSIEGLNWLARNGKRLLAPRRPPAGRPAKMVPEPYGVVGVIGTWNYPLMLNCAPIGAALLGGNAVVWKPSELCAATAVAMDAEFKAARVPVITILGDGSTGRALCDAGCDKVAFTGGVSTGRAILSALAPHGIPSVMELSGNDAMIVCEDSLVELAARSAVWGRCCNAGQSCVAPQRVLINCKVYDRFVAECESTIRTVRPGVEFGPLRNDSLRDKVHEIVAEAVRDGARLVSGGRPLDEMPGFFYAPTLLADCKPGMRVYRQDFFGPVVALYPVDDDEQAITLANDCVMGLGASVWTQDRARAGRLAERIHAGFVTVNDLLRDVTEPGLPFGGVGSSGFGKQHGAEGLEEFVNWKVISAHTTLGIRPHLFPYLPSGADVVKGRISVAAARRLGEKLGGLGEIAGAARRWMREGREKPATRTE
jgi:acyl-CoA reductase-like NAD-dependent aldehyde dehydrogenase